MWVMTNNVDRQLAVVDTATVLIPISVVAHADCICKLYASVVDKYGSSHNFVKKSS